MGINTLLSYLIGRRAAIIQIAQARGVIPLGAMLVLVAGLARTYDAQDLLHQPWHLLIPFAVSSVLALLVLFLLRISMKTDDRYPGFAAAYGRLLGLFWMTAPLALFYAVPFERFCSPGNAMTAKLWSLGLVSLWRLILMTRVISVIFGTAVNFAFFRLVLLADGLIFLALFVVKIPLIQFMGGIHLTEQESVIAGTVMLAALASLYSSPIWLLGTLITSFPRRAMKWQPSPDEANTPVISTTLKTIAIVMILMFAPILVFTQPAQQLRLRTERELKANHIPQALAMMSSHAQSDYPPHWDPPPLPGYGDDTPPLLAVLNEIADHGSSPWVRQIYLRKFDDRYLQSYSISPVVDDAEWNQVRILLKRYPDSNAMMAEFLERDQWRERQKEDSTQPAPTTSPTPATGNN